MVKSKIGSVYTFAGRDEVEVVQLISFNNIIGEIVRVGKISKETTGGYHIDTDFIIGFPLRAAIKGGYLKHLTDLPIPEGMKETKFRFPNLKPGGVVASWTILSQDGQVIVKSLDEEQKKYPLAYAVNIEKLEELLSNGWNGGDLIS